MYLIRPGLPGGLENLHRRLRLISSTKGRSTYRIRNKIRISKFQRSDSAAQSVQHAAGVADLEFARRLDVERFHHAVIDEH